MASKLGIYLIDITLRKTEGTPYDFLNIVRLLKIVHRDALTQFHP